MLNILLLAAAAAAAPKPYSFKTVPLGITIEQFRSWPTDPGTPTCTGDQTKGPEPFEVMVSDYGSSKLGVKKCVYYYWPNNPSEQGTMNGFPIGDGPYSTMNYGFRFVPDPVDKKMRLYEITFVTNIRAMPEIVSTLTATYGPPKGRKTTSMQNGFGASFPSDTVIWLNGVSTIAVVGPFQTVDHVVVAFRLSRLAKIVLAAQNAPPPAANGL